MKISFQQDLMIFISDDFTHLFVEYLRNDSFSSITIFYLTFFFTLQQQYSTGHSASLMNRYTPQYTPSMDQRSQAGRSFRSNTPHPTFNPRQTSLLSLVGKNMVDSRVQVRQRQAEEKELSVRSFNTTKTTSRVSYNKIIFDTNNNEQEDSHETVQTARNYETIQRILKNQNQNLKSQNQLLLRQVHRLKKSNYSYKQQYKKIKIQLEMAKEECEAQKKRADEMKEIIMNRLSQLEGKFNGEDSSHFAIEECESILEALTFSQSQIK